MTERIAGVAVPAELAPEVRRRLALSPVGYRGWQRRAVRRIVRALLAARGADE